MVIIKGCTLEKDHDVQVTQHREGPGLSIVSYTSVCREKDLCNDLSTTLPVWTPSSFEGVRGGGRKKGLRRAERACSLRIPPSHLDWPHSPGLRLPPSAASFDSPGAAVGSALLKLNPPPQTLAMTPTWGMSFFYTVGFGSLVFQLGFWYFLFQSEIGL